MYNGIVNVYKEAGFTSQDVCAKLRGIFGQKKIGHTGTLDPAAEGVLPVCLGNGTKLVDMITDKSKTYRARVLLGITTDTEDTTGTILTEKKSDELMNISQNDILDAVKAYVGGYFQIPPMYSAIKKDGKRLYELARQGIEVKRDARWVDIFCIDVDKIELPYFEMTVHCGKGTYIRSLCRDIGEKLGVGACMEKLVRTQVGKFDIKNALKISQIQEKKDNDILQSIIVPVEDMFEELSRIDVPKELGKLVINGNKLPKKAFDLSGATQNVKVYYNDIFYGVYSCQNDEYILPVKMFACGG